MKNVSPILGNQTSTWRVTPWVIGDTESLPLIYVYFKSRSQRSRCKIQESSVQTDHRWSNLLFLYHVKVIMSFKTTYCDQISHLVTPIDGQVHGRKDIYYGLKMLKFVYFMCNHPLTCERKFNEESRSLKRNPSFQLLPLIIHRCHIVFFML